MRILTYNVRHCLGIDGVLSPSRVASIIAEAKPDVVALQEVDRYRARSDRVDQAQAIAEEVNMRGVYFHAAMKVVDEEYGEAILTTCPSWLKKADALPSSGKREPRAAQWVVAEIGGTAVQIINTHLGLRRPERRVQAEALLGAGWLGHPDCRAPRIVTGDFNSVPFGRVYRRFAAGLCDAHAAGAWAVRPTYPAQLPLFRLDYVFVSPDIRVRAAETLRSPAARLASDHRPLLVELELP